MQGGIELKVELKGLNLRLKRIEEEVISEFNLFIFFDIEVEEVPKTVLEEVRLKRRIEEEAKKALFFKFNSTLFGNHWLLLYSDLVRT